MEKELPPDLQIFMSGSKVHDISENLNSPLKNGQSFPLVHTNSRLVPQAHHIRMNVTLPFVERKCTNR